jgi:hypothetical protein
VSDLSPGLQQIFRAAGRASLPTDADQERVFYGLQARLGIGLEGLGTVATRGTTRALLGKTTVVVAAALVIVAGGLAFMNALTHRAVPEVVSSPVDSVVVSSAPVTLPGAEPSTLRPRILSLKDAPAEGTAGQPTVATPPVIGRRPTRAHDNLAEEAAMLTHAQSELHSGRASSSLKVLAAYDRKFKHGILTQERTAVRIQALCALGRVSEANVLIGGMSPQSLIRESAQQACSSSQDVATHW